MAARRRLTLQVTAGMLVFGLLTFLMGLLIGLSSSPPIAAVPPAGPTAEPAQVEPAVAAAPTEPAAEESDQGTGGGDGAATPAAWQMPAPAVTAPAVTAPAAPAAPAPVAKPVPAVPVQAASVMVPAPAPAKPASKAAGSPPSGAAPAPAKAEPSAAPAPAPAPTPTPTPAEPKKVSGIRVGPPPEELLSSPQRGALVQAATAPPMPEGAAAPPAPPPSRYAVQVARFLLPENAETLAASLRGRGYRPEIVVLETPATPAAPSWHLVVIDPKGDWKTAERLAIEVATTLGLPGQVVSWPLTP